MSDYVYVLKKYKYESNRNNRSKLLIFTSENKMPLITDLLREKITVAN